MGSSQEIAPGKTFRWSGEYNWDLNTRQTRSVALNVFERFNPKLPPPYRKTPFVLLGNISPQLQLQVLAQMERPERGAPGGRAARAAGAAGAPAAGSWASATEVADAHNSSAPPTIARISFSISASCGMANFSRPRL